MRIALTDKLNRTILRTVIDEYYFEIQKALRTERTQAVIQEMPAVPINNDDRNQRFF